MPQGNGVNAVLAFKSINEPEPTCYIVLLQENLTLGRCRNHVFSLLWFLQLQGMLLQNSQVPDIEKLSHQEFDLDVEEQARLEAAGDAEVSRVCTSFSI